MSISSSLGQDGNPSWILSCIPLSRVEETFLEINRLPPSKAMIKGPMNLNVGMETIWVAHTNARYYPRAFRYSFLILSKKLRCLLSHPSCRWSHWGSGKVNKLPKAPQGQVFPGRLNFIREAYTKVAWLEHTCILCPETFHHDGYYISAMGQKRKKQKCEAKCAK